MAGGMVAGGRLPGGTRVQLITAAVVAGLVGLVAVLLAGSAALGSDADRVGLRILVVLAPIAVLLAVIGLTAWLLVRRVRRSADFRRRQLNGPAQATLMIGVLAAYVVGNVARAVSGVDGWTGLFVMVPVGLLVLVPVIMLAKRFDPRVRWFRRPVPAHVDNEEASPSPPRRPW